MQFLQIQRVYSQAGNSKAIVPDTVINLSRRIQTLRLLFLILTLALLQQISGLSHR